MPEAAEGPTPYPDVNALVKELLQSVQDILKGRFIGFYLDGSLANGGFDQDSDIDFVVVCSEEISDELFASLQAMHDRLALLDSPFALQLEGSYLSKKALRRYDSAHCNHPNIERGPGERLKWVRHEEPWNIHRWVLRERGIRLVGPDPKSLIDPLQPDALRQAMRSILTGWVSGLLDPAAQPLQRGYQSYIVLSLCRILFTLENGTVASKQAAAGWAQETLDGRWGDLIERAWEGRHHPDQPPSGQDIDGTRDFARYAIRRGQQAGMG